MKDIVFWLFGAVWVAGIAASVFFMNALLLVVCIAFAAAGAAAYRGWYIIEPLVFRHTGIVELLDGYELSVDRAAAIRRLDKGFSATAAALLDTSKTDELSKERLEDVIHRIGKPFKLSMIVSPLDLTKITNELRTKQYMAEARLSRLQRGKADSARVAQQTRALDEIQRDIGELTSGRLPLRMLYYIMFSSRSESRVVAQEQAVSGIREISSAFDAAMGSRASILSGSELARLLEFDSCVVV